MVVYWGLLSMLRLMITIYSPADEKVTIARLEG